MLIRHPRHGEYAFGFITGQTTLETPQGTTELFAIYVPTNHVYVGDIFLLEASDIIRNNLSVREGIGARVGAVRKGGRQLRWCWWGWPDSWHTALVAPLLDPKNLFPYCARRDCRLRGNGAAREDTRVCALGFYYRCNPIKSNALLLSEDKSARGLVRRHADHLTTRARQP